MITIFTGGLLVGFYKIIQAEWVYFTQFHLDSTHFMQLYVRKIKVISVALWLISTSFVDITQLKEKLLLVSYCKIDATKYAAQGTTQV